VVSTLVHGRTDKRLCYYMSGKLLFLVKCGFTELVQKIFKYGDSENTNLTPDKEVSSLIYGKPFCICVIMCRSYNV